MGPSVPPTLPITAPAGRAALSRWIAEPLVTAAVRAQADESSTERTAPLDAYLGFEKEQFPNPVGLEVLEAL
ncbi:MAG: hypothetical protein WBV64_00030 [Mycobacterium sp.]|jgi:hypothetical protein